MQVSHLYVIQPVCGFKFREPLLILDVDSADILKHSKTKTGIVENVVIGQWKLKHGQIPALHVYTLQATTIHWD